MSRIVELRAQATKIANQARELLNDITSETRAEKEAEYNRMMAEFDTLKRDAEMLETAEARSREFDSIVTQIADETRSVQSNDGAEKRAAVRAAYLTGRATESELRAAGVAVGADGGFTVADAPMAKLVETLVTFGPMLDSRIFNVLNTAGANPLPIPVVGDLGDTADLTAEGAEATETNIAFGQKSLGGYKLTDLVKASDEFLRDSSVNPESYITGLLGKQLGRKANKFLTTGTGSSQPQGIVAGAGVGLTSAVATAVTADEVLRLQYSVDSAYRGVGRYMANDATIVALRLLKDGQGRYIWGAGINGDASETVWGKPLVANNDMANIATGERALIFGDMSNYWVRIAGGVSIQRLNEMYAVNGQRGFLGAMTVDGRVVDSAAIKALVQA